MRRADGVAIMTTRLPSHQVSHRATKIHSLHQPISSDSVMGRRVKCMATDEGAASTTTTSPASTTESDGRPVFVFGPSNIGLSTLDRLPLHATGSCIYLLAPTLHIRYLLQPGGIAVSYVYVIVNYASFLLHRGTARNPLMAMHDGSLVLNGLQPSTM